MRFKLTKKQTRLLISAIVTILISLSGLSYANPGKLEKTIIANEPGYYEITRVDDGDTITIAYAGKEERVRMIGVDTPETHHPQKAVQCFGVKASQFTAELVGEGKVRLEADPEDDNRDIYGRLLRYVYLQNGTLVNAEIIKQGYGFAYTRFPFSKLEEFRDYERTAREQGLGLWGGCQVEDDGTTKSTNPAQ